MEKLTCNDCGYANESERVYCHNCGVKLDRSVLPENDPEEQARRAKARRKAAIKPRKINPFRPLAFLGKLFLVALYSCIAATLIQAALPPGDIPELSEEAAMMAPMILMDLEEAAGKQVSSRVVYTEEQANAYLKSVIRGKKPGGGFLKDAFRFERVFVKFGDQRLRVGTVQHAFNHPLYASVDLEAEIAQGKILHQTLGGSIGRLNIPGPIMRMLDGIFSRVWSALEKEKTAVARAQSIVFEEGAVGVFYRGNL